MKEPQDALRPYPNGDLRQLIQPGLARAASVVAIDTKTTVESRSSDVGQTDEKPEIRVRRAAMNLLARREQSFYELTRKITQKFPELDREEVILPALERLREENLQSDDRFIESYVRYRSSRGIGPLKIAMELDQKGVSGSRVQAEVYSSAQDWVGLCREVMARKFSEQLPASLDEKQKRYRFLQQRGFENAQIRQVLG